MSGALAHVNDTANIVTISEGTALLQIIDRASRDPSVDLDKMERLLAMHQAITARNAEAAFNAAMGTAQAEMPQVTRDAVNDQTRSRYARLETISKAMNPVITRHGFAMSFGTADCPLSGHYRITCDVSHREGHTRRYHADIPSDGVGMKGTANKTATHAFGSTMSYGRRYLKTMIFDVSATNEDDDGQGAGRQAEETISEEQVMAIREMLEATDCPVGKYLEFAKLERLEDMPVSAFENAMLRLRQRAARR